ncbi:MAG: efflux transporter outer membrane subunit [Hydromonas sp.]|nr:efflux transporter outer membrane subunit [Hydromonas sp.]
MRFYSKAFRIGVLSLTVSTLCACAVVTGKHETLAQVDNARLNLPEVSGRTLAQWPQQGWWTQYNSPTLNALIEQAMRDGPSLKVLATRIDASQNAADAVRKLSYPMGQVKVDWTGQEFFNTRIDGATPQSQAALSSRGIPTNPSDQFIALTNISAGISWDLDLWGHNRALYGAALGLSRAQTLEYEAARQGVIANIVGLHAQIMAFTERANIVDKQIATQTTLRQRWLEREQAGLQPTQNSVQVDMTLAQLAQLKQSLMAQKAVARAQLAALIGQTPEQLAEFFPEQTWQTLNLPQNIPVQILGTRPDIAAAREYIVASTEQVNAVKAEFYPNINIGLSTALQLLNLQDILDFRGQNAAVKPAISLPIFNTIQLNAKLRQQQAQLDNTIAQYNQTVFQAVSDAHQQLAQYRQAQAYLTAQARIVKDNQTLTDLSAQRYRAGMSPQMESLMYQTATLREQDALVMGYAMRRAQEARLASSLGTEFSDLIAGKR